MRIVAGRYKGHRLPALRGRNTRPTMDRVREAVFSSIGPAVQGARVLELFAGTGAFGFEALSRGAEFAIFVDRDRKVADLIAQTARTLGVSRLVTIWTCSAAQAVKRLTADVEQFDLMFLDPPYEGSQISGLLSDRILPNLLSPGGLLVVERGSTVAALSVPAELERRFDRRYGGTQVEIFRKQSLTESSPREPGEAYE